MSTSPSVRDLHAQGFQQREWAVQIVGRILVILLLLAAVLGLFGTGPLSHVRAEQGAVSVEYERFVRHTGHAQLEVRAPAPAPGTSSVSVEISGGLAAGIRMEDIQPQPATVRRSGTSTEFVFAAVSDTDALITFYYRPMDIGPQSGTVTVADAAAVDVWQLTYP